MDLTCNRDFALRYQKTVNGDHTFSADICFKKGEDLEITTEKLFKQDSISSIYFKDGYYHMIDSVNNLAAQSDTALLIQNFFDNPNQLKEVNKKWEKFFNEKNEQESQMETVSPFHRLTRSEIDKFIKVIGSNRAKFAFAELVGTFRIHVKKAKEGYEEAVERLNKKQAEDIEKMALDNRNEVEINTKVQQHLNQLEEEKILFKKKISSLTQDTVKLLKETIAAEYEKAVKKQSNSGSEPTDQPKKTISKGSVASRNSVQIPQFKVQVMLGLQKKYPFKIKLIQKNIATFLEEERVKNVFDVQKKKQLISAIEEKFKLVGNVKDSADIQDMVLEFLNPFYGAFGSALVNSLPFDTKSGTIKLENSALYKLLKYEPDLHFESFETQIKGSTEQEGIEEGDVIVTMHSNLGFIKNVFNFLESTGPFKEGAFDGFLCSALMVAVQKRIRKVILPLEIIYKKKVGMGGSDGGVESFNKVIRSLRLGLQQIAHNYLSNEFLYEIVMVIPKSETEQDLFGKCKEILKKAFE